MSSCLTCGKGFKSISGLRGHEQFLHRGDPPGKGTEQRNAASNRAAREQLQRQREVVASNPFNVSAGSGTMEIRLMRLERELVRSTREQRELQKLLRRDPTTGYLVLDDEGADDWGFVNDGEVEEEGL